MIRNFGVAFCCITLGFTAPFAFALDPTQFYEKEGDAAFDHFGQSIAPLGDLNHDGYDDFAIGAPTANTAKGEFAGYARVYSGATGGILYEIQGEVAFEDRGWIGPLGDVNADGTPDFGVGSTGTPPGAPNGAGAIAVYSGANGRRLYEVRGREREAFGHEFDGIGDVNGDGRSDFIVGMAFVKIGVLERAGAIEIRSGLDGALLRRIEGTTEGGDFGASVSGTGDVDKDGVPDLVVGAPGSRFLPSENGTVTVFSGATGAEIYRFRGEAPADHLGWSVDGVGDIDGDGVPDIVAGAPFATLGIALQNGMTMVFSGATGETIYRLPGVRSDDQFGYSVAGAGDVDGDGRNDLIVGAYFAHAPGYGSYGGDYSAYGAAYVYSGRTAELLFQKAPPEWKGFSMGYAVASAGDVNGDGRADVIVSAPINPLEFPPGEESETGYAWVYGLPAPTIAVDVDIRPGSCPNSFNPTSRGLLPVALLGGAGFDPAGLDPASIRLNGVPPSRVSETTGDLGTSRSEPSANCHCPSTALDGLPDRQLWFDTAALAATLPSPAAGGDVVLTLTGAMADGARIRGGDCVRLVGRTGSLASVLGNARSGGVGVRYRVPAEGANVRVSVYSVGGRRIAELARGFQPGGEHTVHWDGRDFAGARVAGGVYFLKTEVDAEQDVSKVTILR